MEDLTKWKPIWRINYAGYRHGDKTDEPDRAGRVIIHISNEEHIGGFYIHRSGSVKIWYKDGNLDKLIYVPFNLCTFTKRRDGNLNIYDVVINNSQNGESMNDTSNTEKLSEKGGLDIIGRDEMIYIRNRYQSELDRDYDQIKRIVNHLNDVRNETKEKRNKAEALKENIDSKIKEKDSAFTTLQNLLNKEEKYEDKMLDKTLRGMKAKGRAIIKQKLKDVDIDTLQYGSVEQYKRLYPHYGTEILGKIKELTENDAAISKAEEAWRNEAQGYNYLLEITDKNIQDAKDRLAKYDETKKQGGLELKSCRYYTSIFYKMASKKTKTLLNLDTLKHDTNGLVNTLKIVEKTFSAYSNKPLEPISIAK